MFGRFWRRFKPCVSRTFFTCVLFLIVFESLSNFRPRHDYYYRGLGPGICEWTIGLEDKGIVFSLDEYGGPTESYEEYLDHHTGGFRDDLGLSVLYHEPGYLSVVRSRTPTWPIWLSRTNPADFQHESVHPNGTKCLQTKINCHTTYAVVPFWIIETPAAIVIIFIIFRRCRRRDPQDCWNCGYHLSFNTSGCCPECGLAISDENREAISDISTESAEFA